jgi:DNA primase catalytic subunit
MSKYFMPEGMRLATLEERKEFYLDEFNLKKAAEWIKARTDKVKFAVIIGKHTKIFPLEYREDADTKIIVDEYESLEEVQSQIVEFLPEAVYYDRTVYDANDRFIGQELAFDLDPENIVCPIHGTLADRIKRHQGLSFCITELELAKDQTVRLYEYLEEQFSDLRIAYSGRGFHIHVFDKKAYALSRKQRMLLAEKVKEKGFSIDTWVTTGEMPLIRLPYSLHGMVSRIVLPLEKKEITKFDPVSDARCVPAFLKGKLTTSS